MIREMRNTYDKEKAEYKEKKQRSEAVEPHTAEEAMTRSESKNRRGRTGLTSFWRSVVAPILKRRRSAERTPRVSIRPPPRWRFRRMSRSEGGWSTSRTFRRVHPSSD